METESVEKEVDKNQGFKPNEEYLKILLEMGISKNIAEKALRETNNSSIDLAASRALEIFENCSDDDNWADIDEFKMSFIINDSLNMSPGKLAAQVAHGALSIYRQLIENPAHTVDVSNWIENGETKIILKGTDEKALLYISQQAQDIGLASSIIRDAGRTEVPPNSLTVLVIFGPVDKVDSVTKKLRLL